MSGGGVRPIRRTTQRGVWGALPARASRIRTELLYALVDVVIVVLSYSAILEIRFIGDIPEHDFPHVRTFIVIAALTVLAVHASAGLYTRVWQYASILEARRLLAAGALTTILLTALVTVGPRLVPISVAALGAVFTTMVVGLSRFQSRIFALHRAEERQAGLRVVVVGAGLTGASLVRQMLLEPRAGLVPVALVDDDPRLQARSVNGVRVRGTLSDLQHVCASEQAHQIILAIPGAPRALVAGVADVAEACGASLRVIADIGAFVRGEARLADVRDLNIEDLLGREQVVIDLAAVHRLITGRRVLVTGAGGSIGSEIARQVAACRPAELVLLDHDETHLHDVSESLAGEHHCLLLDLRDRRGVDLAIDEHRPEVVFHAAAHKHVPILEDFPDEAVRTNVSGTAGLVDACVRAGTPHFVLISTDKAVHPSSVMGASKRLAEQVVLAAAAEHGLAFCAVRFGNVLGSRGSVIPTFVQQIAQGGPVTVTDPRMTRYFMSIPEAVQLVLQSAALAGGGEVFMLDMGEPVSIVDLARRMIRLSGRRLGIDVEIRFTGARPGEKLVEELREPAELTEPTEHPSILRIRPVPPEALSIATMLDELSEGVSKRDRVSLREAVLALAHQVSEVEATIDLRNGVESEENPAWSRSTI